MNRGFRLAIVTGFGLVAVFFLGVARPVRGGGLVSLTTVRDNSLFEYDPAEDPTLNSNGSGDFFSAGRSLNRSLIRRGLMAFDLSGLSPTARVQVGTARLNLYVVSVPRRDPATRPFWLVPAAQDWSEGSSSVNDGASGSGNGAPATLGDATWYHTHFDPSLHDTQSFDPSGEGYWQQRGALGHEPLDPWQTFGPPIGEAASEVGPVSWEDASLEADINAWLAGAPNFGWLIVGDETVESDELSSQRAFASREHANVAFRPELSFAYVVSDLSADGIIDAQDAAILFAHWGTGDVVADINADGLTDAADAGAMFEEWTGDARPVTAVPEPVLPACIVGSAVIGVVMHRRPEKPRA